MAMRCGSAQYDNAKKEQIVTEFFAKSLHIILEARSPFVSSRNYSGESMSSPASSTSSSSSYRPRDKWFNLALQECPAALENIDFWRQSNLEPMVVDVILIRRSLDREPVNFSPDEILFWTPSSKEQQRLEKRHEKVIERVIERWVVQYENQKSKDTGSSSKRSGANLNAFYKNLLVLLRSLYSTVRLLPGYKLFRKIISSGQIRAYTLTHRLRSCCDPCTHRDEADMQRFRFTPVYSNFGRISVSVSYKASLPDLPSEPSSPMSPRIIAEYVGSPLVDPLKRFPSLPVSHSPPSYSPIGRNNSWGADIFHALPDSAPSVRPPPMSLPPGLPDASQGKYRYMGIGEVGPSPSFSTPTSIAPPTHLPHGNLANEFLQSDGAPARVCAAQHPSTSLPPPSPSRPGNVLNGRSSDQSNSVAEKCSVRKDETGRASGARLLFDSSPRVSFIRSLSRLECDDSEFACPFVIDEDETMDLGDSQPESRVLKSQTGEPSEPGGGSAPPRKSQDAAVGALVLMLNKALPLHHDSVSVSTNSLPASQPKGSSNIGQDCHRMSREVPSQSSGAVSSSIVRARPVMKTSAFALEELRSYKEMKESLLKQGSWSRYASDKN